MGDRYFVTVVCAGCGFTDDNVYYAPTCDFVSWKCPYCETEVSLENVTGISYEDASNKNSIQDITDFYKDMVKDITDYYVELDAKERERLMLTNDDWNGGDL